MARRYKQLSFLKLHSRFYRVSSKYGRKGHAAFFIVCIGKRDWIAERGDGTLVFTGESYQKVRNYLIDNFSEQVRS